MTTPWWFDQADDERTPDEIRAAATAAYREGKDRLRQRDEDRAAQRARFKTTEEIIEEAIADARAGDQGAVTSGWPTIDAALARPVRPGEVVLIGARTGVGKSWIAQHLVWRKLDLDHSMRALFLNVEMSHAQMGVRIGGYALGVSPREFDQKAYRGELTAAQVTDQAAHMRRVLWHEDAVTADQITELHAQACDVAEAPFGIIVVDYLGLLAWSGRGGAPIYERASENARMLKQIAKETRTVLIVCAQLSRGGARDGSVEPDLSAFRDSGGTEEGADRALLFWRPTDDDGDPQRGQLGDGVQIRGKVAKNRHGSTGRPAVLEFDYALRLREVEDAELYAVSDDEQAASEAALAAQDADDGLPY